MGSPRIGELLARPRTDTASLVRALGGVCQEIDPALLCEPRTLAWWASFQRLPFFVASVIAGALGLLALVAALIPARKAMGADPVVSLRAD